MKNLRIFVVLMVILFISLTSFAQEANEKKRKNPFACLGEAITLSKRACFTEQEYTNLLKNSLSAKKILEPLIENRNDKVCVDIDKLYKLSDDKKKALIEAFTKIEKHAKMSLEKIHREIERLKALKPQDAHSICIIAELMKRVGDYQAEDYYNKAIEANETEPAYELFFADYLRNFRGALHPLFPEAEEHYFKALRKLKQVVDNWKEFDYESKKQIERGLTTLYQEDGFPIDWKSSHRDSKEFLEQPPFVFFSSINNYAESTTDFDEVDDVRDFTSEALFASSEMRLNRTLTEDELRGIIRKKEQFETLNRLRFRYRHWPVFDIFYRYRELNNAQITNFYEPNEFNHVSLNEYGLAFQKPFNFSSYFDFFFKGIYKKTEREGIIEFLPDEREDINHYEAKAVISRFFGSNKANLEFVYVFQDINQDIPNPIERERQIVGSTITLQIFSQKVYKQLFEPRGLDLFAGIVEDKEKYGETIVKKNDFFAGSAFKNINFLKENALDIRIQPTIFTYEVGDDESRDNSQYRTNITLLYRIRDEEKTKKGFVHLVIPFRHDVAIDGPEDFENYKVGIGLNTKVILTKLRRTTFLISARYDYQRFFRLDKNLNLFGVNVSMGF